MPNEKPKGVSHSDGKTFFDLGAGWTPLEFLVMVKCLDPKGRVRYREMTSQTLHPVEALGMISTMGDTLRHKLMRDAGTPDRWDE